MGSIADSVLDHGGKVTGVIPRMLVEWERQHLGLSELVISDDMHERKRKIYSLCDAALILPGGFGTLDELFEIITWNQLTIHDKLIFILNSDGFYDHLIAHIARIKQEGFLYEEAYSKVFILERVEELGRYI
jgi:uncharacterized protein (TIGR00730 family)